MYTIISNVIKSRNYELNDMLRKIDTIWVQGSLTDEERDELVELARSNADLAKSYDPLQEQINKAFVAIKALEERVKALEAGEAPEPGPEPEEWPAWVQPTGAHDAYQAGDKISFNGKHYICQMNGCVWSPSDYPQGWTLQ